MVRGKILRLNRIIDVDTKKTIIVPMDHGVTMGPVKGLEKIDLAFSKMIKGGANAVIIHKGMMKSLNLDKITSGIIIHLSASTLLNPDPLFKTPVCDVEEALSHGADAVSIHVNLGADSEPSMLNFMGQTARECSRWGLPLLAMMYAHGKLADNQNSIKIAARVGAELGADIIKCQYTGDAESFSEVVDGCPVPVVIAGGEKTNDKAALKMIEGAMLSGAAGLSIGRNAFQHNNSELFINAAGSIVHEGCSAEEAYDVLMAKKSVNILKINRNSFNKKNAFIPEPA